MKKNGFTLVELLAVMMILGLIMVIVGRKLIISKKDASINEILKIERTLKDLGGDIYLSYRKQFSPDEKYKISLYALKDYVKNIKCDEGTKECTIENPAGGNFCDAYLLIDTTEGVEDMFGAYIDCGDIYKTDLQSYSIDDYSVIDTLITED